MKQYKVIIEPMALKAIDNEFQFIHKTSPQNAKSWLVELDQAIESLETMPHRGSLIRENESFQLDLRELLHFSHRVVFSIDETLALVLIHAVRHSSRDEIENEELGL